MKMYCIFDKRAQLYSAPHLFANDDLAKRSLADMSRNSLIERFPDDFDVYCVGSFDDANKQLPLSCVDAILCFSFSEVFK